ncbi:hypothetical protein DBV15_06698, partial [Temnothorax longispinosus]
MARVTVSVDVKPTHYSLSAGAPCPNLFFFHGSKMRREEMDASEAKRRCWLARSSRGRTSWSEDRPGPSAFRAYANCVLSEKGGNDGNSRSGSHRCLIDASTLLRPNRACKSRNLFLFCK